MSEHDIKENHMLAQPETNKTKQEEIDNIANVFEVMNISEDIDCEYLTCQAIKKDILPAEQTEDIDNTDHAQVTQEFSNKSESKHKHCSVDVKFSGADNDAVKIEDNIELSSLHTCECSAPCEFNIPDLPKLTTKSPSQLLKIMTLFSHWDADLSKKLIELLLQLSSERAISDCVPEEKFLRAIASCPNASKLHEKDSIDESGIRVLFQNINGFSTSEEPTGKYINNLCTTFLSSDYKIFVITESHLKPKIPSSVFNCYGVSIIRCDRENAKIASGGVAILYKPPISIASLTDITQSDYYKSHKCEMLACLASLYSGIYTPINLITVYQPPDPSNGGIKRLIEHLESLLTADRCVLLGDFNLQKTRKKNKNSDKEIKWPMSIKFFDFLETEKNMVQKVTESTMVKSDTSIIDLVFVSSDLKEQKATVIGPVAESDHKSVEFLIPFTSIAPFPSTSSSFSQRLSKSDPHLNTQSNATSGRVRRTKSCFADVMPTLVKVVASINWTSVFEKCSSISEKLKAFYERMTIIVKRYANSEHQTEMQIPDFIVDGKQTAGDEDKADDFGKYLSNDIPDVTELPRTQTDGHPLVCSRIFESAVIQEHLANLPETQDPSFYLVNEDVLRQCSQSLAEPLSLLFTELLKTTFVPDAWKNYIRKVVPEGTSEAKYNIRYNNDPLADVMNGILCEFIRKTYSCCFSPRQMENHPDESFYTAQEGLKLAVVQFDFQDALSEIPQHQLIAEAENIGLHSIICKWFNEFLSNRTYSAKVKNYIKKDTAYFLPPTTALGSNSQQLFESIFINFMLLNFSSQVSCSFTSDLKCWSHSTKYMQTCINYIEKWCRDNGISLDNCKITSYHRGPSTFDHDYTFNGITVPVRKFKKVENELSLTL